MAAYPCGGGGGFCIQVCELWWTTARGYHSSVTSLTSLSCRARHIIPSDEYLGDAMNEVMTEILTKRLHHDISSLA